MIISSSSLVLISRGSNRPIFVALTCTLFAGMEFVLRWDGLNPEDKKKRLQYLGLAIIYGFYYVLTSMDKPDSAIRMSDRTVDGVWILKNSAETTYLQAVELLSELNSKAALKDGFYVKETNSSTWHARADIARRGSLTDETFQKAVIENAEKRSVHVVRPD